MSLKFLSWWILAYLRNKIVSLLSSKPRKSRWKSKREKEHGTLYWCRQQMLRQRSFLCYNFSLELTQPIQLKLSDQKCLYVFLFSIPIVEARAEIWKKIVGFLRKLLLIVHDLQLIWNDTLNSKTILAVICSWVRGVDSSLNSGGLAVVWRA